MSRVTLLTYAGAPFVAGQKALAASALAVGFDAVIKAGPANLIGSAIEASHPDVLSAERGGGYWLWKPWLIRENLRNLADDDILFYCDASIDGFYAFDKFPTELVSRVRASTQGFVIGPMLYQHGPLKNWTKGDAFHLLGCNPSTIGDQPTIQATWSLWRNTPSARSFVDRWLDASMDRRILTDIDNTIGENDRGFVEHRYDQSILSILCYRDGYEALDLTSTGIFRIMALRLQSEMTHRLLKAPRNVERLLRGQSAWRVFIREMLAQRWRRLRR